MQLDSDQVSMLEWGFKGVCGILFSVGVWVWSKLVSTIVQIKLDVIGQAKDLAEHKLDISERYAKKDDIKEVKDTLKDVQNDIKELLGRKRSE